MQLPEHNELMIDDSLSITPQMQHNINSNNILSV